MSASTQDETLERFNKYLAQRAEAANKAVRTILHLVRPAENFPYYYNDEIAKAWRIWRDDDKVFQLMTSGSYVPKTMPVEPREDAEHRPCRRMWGLLLQQQLEGECFQAQLITDAVAEIVASQACKSHPPTCACKVPNNPWTLYECVTALEPLNVAHNANCQCGGYGTCSEMLLCSEEEEIRQQFLDHEMEQHFREEELARRRRLAGECSCSESPCACRKSVYDYDHKIETCACGTCYAARQASKPQENTGIIASIFARLAKADAGIAEAKAILSKM